MTSSVLLNSIRDRLERGGREKELRAAEDVDEVKAEEDDDARAAVEDEDRGRAEEDEAMGVVDEGATDAEGIVWSTPSLAM